MLQGLIAALRLIGLEGQIRVEFVLIQGRERTLCNILSSELCSGSAHRNMAAGSLCWVWGIVSAYLCKLLMVMVERVMHRCTFLLAGANLRFLLVNISVRRNGRPPGPVLL